MKTENEILKEFMALTGADEACSKALLISCKWNIKEADLKYKQSFSPNSEKTKAGNDEVRGGEVNSNDIETTGNQRESNAAAKGGGVGKMSRGFSMVDPEMVSKLHKDLKTKGDDDTDDNYGYFQDVTHYSFTLPDFSLYDKDFIEFLMRDLIENSTLKTLEESGHLNWWTKNNGYHRLLPLATSGDGNCLLHAASLGIWGVHDRLLNLREAVHRTLSSNLAERTIKRRWRWYEWVRNMGGEEMVWEPTEKEWETEWQSVLSLAIAKPRSPTTKQSLMTVPEQSDVTPKEADSQETKVDSTQSKPRRFSISSETRYESLEEIHIFSLAHVLCRPIVVVADTMLYDFEGNPLCPIPFGGVYLPVECNPAECCRIPLVLAYSSGHFSPLVAMARQMSNSNVGSHDVSEIVIPLVNKSLETLPLPFAVDPGKSWDWTKKDSGIDVVKKYSLNSEERMKLLKKYMDVITIPVKLPSNNQKKPVGQSALVPKAFATGEGGDGIGGENQAQTLVEHSIAVAELPCCKQPGHYQELITGYIEKAKERFKFEQETKEFQSCNSDKSSMQCANDGCDLYGTVANNYLCTKCFQLQTKSIKEFTGKCGPSTIPPYDPPCYADAIKNNVFIPPSLSSSKESASRLPTLLSQVKPTQCKTKGCTFYGTIDKGGFCSKCYQDKNRS